MTRRNSVNWQGDETMAAIRAGQGLLVGLLHCGRKLHVRYWGGSGTHARYLCRGDYDDCPYRKFCAALRRMSYLQTSRRLKQRSAVLVNEIRRCTRVQETTVSLRK